MILNCENVQTVCDVNNAQSFYECLRIYVIIQMKSSPTKCNSMYIYIHMDAIGVKATAIVTSHGHLSND